MIRARRRSIYCSPAEWAEVTERSRSASMRNSPFVIACALAEDDEERPDTLLALTEEEQSVNRLSILTPNRRTKLTPLSGTAEVVPVANRGDPRGFV